MRCLNKKFLMKVGRKSIGAIICLGWFFIPSLFGDTFEYFEDPSGGPNGLMVAWLLSWVMLVYFTMMDVFIGFENFGKR